MGCKLLLGGPMQRICLLLLGSLVVAQEKPAALPEDPLVKHTRFIVDRVLAFNDPQEKIIALSRIAAVVCKRDRAEGAALFERDAEFLKVFELDRPIENLDKQAQGSRLSLRRNLRD